MVRRGGEEENFAEGVIMTAQMRQTFKNELSAYTPGLQKKVMTNECHHL
jgi:hypothetical protein